MLEVSRALIEPTYTKSIAQYMHFHRKIVNGEDSVWNLDKGIWIILKCTFYQWMLVSKHKLIRTNATIPLAFHGKSAIALLILMDKIQ